ncbi:MAG: DNA replication/repair protein RecF [Prevotella sp.]|nr:DNA replication/repair protein RecF [Prevotella sp.]
MILQKISIVNYKNIREASLELSPKINCLIGHNGAGKTNLLDAIYFLSFCRSAFYHQDSLAITHGQEFFVLEGEYSDDTDNANVDVEKIYCGLKRGTKKRFKRNGKEYKRLSQHIGLIPVIMVSPSDSILVEGGSEERRRLMDMVIAQYNPLYIDDLANYNKALQQRNALLKQEQEPDTSLMEILEMQMAETGERIYTQRQQYVEQMSPVLSEIYRKISGDKETVELNYVSHCQRGPLFDVISRDRYKDRAVGYSLHGIHRDDLEMHINGYPIRREGSQGQTKSFVIALKIAQFDFLRRTHSNTTPLLLLDDVFDKLDASRVERIIDMVAGEGYGQIFITDTNRDHLDKILQRSEGDYKIFDVEDGTIALREEHHV